MATTYLRGTNLQGYATPSGYRLQAARSGLGGLSYLQQGAPTREYQQRSYTPTVDTSSRPVSEDDLSRARNAQALAVQDYGRNNPSNIQIGQVRSGWMGNLNPELYGGLVDVKIDGETLRVPNAVMQQLMFTDSWNQGRSSAVSDFFGGRQQNPDPEVYRYSTYGAAQGRFDDILQRNPQWAKEGALNPYTAAQENWTKADNRYKSLMGEVGQMQEYRDVAGNDASAGRRAALQQQAEQAKRERDSYAGELNKDRATYYGNQIGTQRFRSMYDAFKEGMSPTRSNLPVTEKFIR